MGTTGEEVGDGRMPDAEMQVAATGTGARDRLLHTLRTWSKARAAFGDPLSPKGPLSMVPLLPDQFVHVYDHARGRLLFAQGYERVLGFPDGEMSVELALDLIHPDDAPMMMRILEAAARCMHSVKPAIRPFESVLSLDCRMRKANGAYVKVLRQVTVCEVDEEMDEVRCTLNISKDISNIKHSDHIGWQALGRGIEDIDLAALVAENANLLYRPTARERDVLRLIAEGRSSREIGEYLGLSTHTVNTHRRNLLRNTGLANAAELVLKATSLGWI